MLYIYILYTYAYTFKSSIKVKLLLKTRNEIEHFYFWDHVRRTHLSRGLLVVSVFTDFLALVLSWHETIPYYINRKLKTKMSQSLLGEKI